MDKRNPKETFLLVVQQEVKEMGKTLKDMQLVRKVWKTIEVEDFKCSRIIVRAIQVYWSVKTHGPI